MPANPFDALDDIPQDTLQPGPAPSLADRFMLNFEAGRRYNTVLGAIGDVTTSARVHDRQRFDAKYQSYPDWQSWGEGAAALAGQIAGTAASPENFIPLGLGEKILVGGKMAVTGLWAKVFSGAVDAAAVNAVADLSIQGLENVGGSREGFDPIQFGASVLLGTVIGGAGGAVARGGQAAGEIASTVRASGDLTRQAPAEAGQAAPEVAPPVPENPDMAPADVELPPVIVRPEGEPGTLGETLSEQAANARGLTTQERRILREQTPVGPAPRKPVHLTRFLANIGGVADQQGELRALDAGNLFVPGAGRLVREEGRPLDYAREAAAEAGYFDHLYGDRDSAVAKSTVADLLEAIDQDMRGQRVYSSEDAGRVEAVTAHEEATAARDLLRSKLDRISQEIEAELPDEIVIRATERMDDGLDAVDAVEAAVMEDYYANGSPIPLEREDGSEIDIPFFDDGGGVPAERAADARGDDAGQAVRSPDARSNGEPSGDAGAPEGRASERTEAGEQILIDGIAPVSARERIEARAAKPMRGGDKAAGGLFDETVRDQADIADFLAMSQPLGGLRDQAVRARAGRAASGVAAKAAENIGRVRETAEALAKALGVAATRQQRMGQKAAVKGIYKLKSGVVRVRSLDDFDVLTHEYGHHVEKRIPGMTALMKKHAAELAPLDYDPSAGRPTEGFAEFFRLWITNRAAAEKAAPKFAAAFAAELAKHAEIRTAIDAAADAWRAFLDAPSSVAVASTIVSGRRKGVVGRTAEALKKEGLAGTIHDVLQRLYMWGLDDLGPLGRAVDELRAQHLANTKKPLDLPVSKDPYKLARLSRGAYSEGHMDVMYGVAPYGGIHPESPSLRDAIIEATGKPNGLSAWDDEAVRSFGSYLWSRRALGEWDRFDAGDIPNPPDKLTRGDHAQNVAELEAAFPQFVSAAGKVHEFSRALWKKKRDAGLIDSETYERGLAIVDYVPGLRDFSSDTEAKVSGGRKGRGGSAKFGLVKRFRGSKRDVINPLESLAADAYETAMAISRNDVVKALDRLALTAGPGGGAIAERIPAHEIRGTLVDPIEAVENAARAAGLARPDVVMLRDALESAIGDEKAAVFRPAVINEKGEPIVYFRDGGQLVALRLADGRFGLDMYRAMTGMTRLERNFFIELLAMPARLLRLGITTAFEFVGANFVRDQAMAAIFYGRPLQRVRRSLQGAGDDLLGSETARVYSRVHGLSGGQETHSLASARVERDLSALRHKGWAAQRLTSFRGILTIAETAETATRLGLFRTFMAEAKKRGLSDMEAALEASWRARDYLDFDRRGSVLGAVSRIVPFFNVALQGLDKATRHMIAPLAKKMLGEPMSAAEERALGEAAKSWARLGVLTVASMSLYALMSRNEDQDEISTYTRSTHWMLKLGEKWIAIPKPFEFATVINLGEAAYDAFAKKDPSAQGRWLDSLHYTLMPPSLIEGNPGLRSYFELRTNTDFFTDSAIVPEWMQGMEPWLQYTSRNSALSKQIGKAFDVSPAIVDHLIVNHLGSWGRSALSLYDLAQPDAPGFAWDDAPISRRFIKDAARGAQSVTMFWDMMSERTGTLEGKARSWRAMMDAGDAAGAADYYAAQDEQGKAYIAISAMDAEVRRLHPLVRARGAVQAIGQIRRALASGRLTDAFGSPIAISPAARTAADDVLSTLSMAMARNALVMVGEPGWAQRDEIPEEGFYRELSAISPELAQRLADGFATAHVWKAAAVEKAWPELKARLLADGSEAPVLDLKAGVEAEGNPLPGIRIRKPAKPQLTLP